GVQTCALPISLYPGACSTDRIGTAAISGQFANSSGIQRAWSANEFGREGRPVSEADRGDGASCVRIWRKAISQLAEDAFAVLPEPRGPGEMASAPADRNNRAARSRRCERDTRGAHFVCHRTHRDATRD